ncbi:shikimate dehydrogenase [Novosphingobium sp. FSY-8]|uniref:Shikimate dehydrogenase (NADP(+)) n=2 Tax=Novosphingobium ovatum TaxID=1908523 RepID=A0ABW9XCB1_9SPHN|nr:shikimate dehydrogenase [Novosphingobium ovatum]
MVGVGRGRVLAGLIGRGILESRTPWMHECEADAQGLRMVYSLFDFSDRGWADEDLGAAIDAAQRVGFAGLNVTFPFKQSIIPLLDELSPQAAAIGAVNTVALRDGRRIGYNTDVTGFAEAFQSGLPDAPRDRVLQLGCGGAGSATAHALLSTLGARHVLLFDPEAARAEALRAQLAALYGDKRVAVTDNPTAAAAKADGIINATPIGMAKFPGTPLPAAAIEARHWVSDIVYFPLETALLAEARARGCRVLNGRGMAVGQAADAFAIFTGLTPDRARMADSFAAFATATPSD